MEHFVRLVGPQRAVELFGVRLVGVNADNAKKLVLMLLFVAAALALAWLLRRLAQALIPPTRERARFWARQGVQLFTTLLVFVGVASIWFDEPARLAGALGLMTAGLAFALQKVVTALAGYLVILRGKTFNVGDRIVMGGVRGDVLALSLTQTTIMEMGQPPPVQNADPAMWVKSRQYTGRVVTVSNARIFDEPVYNYTRDFPYIWEEMSLPVGFEADRARAEQILLEVARRHSETAEALGREALDEMRRRYFMAPTDVAPRVFYRLTDNWLELTVRFVVRDHGVRDVKDAMSREILDALEAAGIQIASSSFGIVSLPPLRIERVADRRRGAGPDGPPH